MATQTYWLVAGKSSQSGVAQVIAPHLLPNTQPNEFQILQGGKALKFGSFDNLIKLTDDLHKHDSAVEGVLRRVERQWTEIDENAAFQIVSGGGGGQKVGLESYLRAWKWDETKFSTAKTMQGTIEFLMQKVVGETDELIRKKATDFNEVKAQKQAHQKREGVPFPSRDLIDLFQPGVVEENDFVETEHLTTVVVFLARGQEKDFLPWYGEPTVTTTKMVEGKEVELVDRIEDPVLGVVPESAKKFDFSEGPGGEDKDGNTVWRVVLFKSAKKKFIDLARHQKFMVREFVYSKTSLQELEKKRDSLEVESRQAEAQLKNVCESAWSDVFVAWMHIKAMRVFVEGVLRFGVQQAMNCSIICPKPAAVPQLRKALADSLGPQNSKKMQEDADADGEEYHPYVSLSFTPVTSAPTA